MRNKSEGARNRARAYRKNPSVAEKWMWRSIRNDKLGFRFRRQFPIGQYTLDFYCPEAKVCIEMDSDLHDVIRDKIRDECLSKHGILTIRIQNVDYLGLGDEPCTDWMSYIQKICEDRTGRPPFSHSS
ncbi:MAG: DUF559 domain-containing protein [Armatimonadota bacterium]